MAFALLAPAAMAEPAADGAAKQPGPVIEVRETSKDGGVVEEGTIVHYRFTVANRGQADLEVTRVKPDCGCTVPNWDKLIKPGQEGAIQVELHTDFFRGPVTKHLTVFSNDPARPELPLVITARVTPLVNVTPGTAALLSVGDEPATQEFTLERTGGHPMKIVQVIANAPYLDADATPLSGEGRYKVTVTATKETPLGRSIVPVVVRTDMPKAGMVTLVVTVDRGIVTVPPMVFYGLLPPEVKTPTEAAVTITRRSAPFHITEATADDPKLQVKLETVQAGTEYKVTVIYSGGWDVGLARKTLTVKTDDPKQPVLSIPIQAVIQAKTPPTPIVIQAKPGVTF